MRLGICFVKLVKNLENICISNTVNYIHIFAPKLFFNLINWSHFWLLFSTFVGNGLKKHRTTEQVKLFRIANLCMKSLSTYLVNNIYITDCPIIFVKTYPFDITNFNRTKSYQNRHLCTGLQKPPPSKILDLSLGNHICAW